MITKRHRARRIALHLLFAQEYKAADAVEEQVKYLTREEVMLESIASELSEEDVEERVKEILKDVEYRERNKLRPREQSGEAEELCQFATELVGGVRDFRDEIDRRIEQQAEHWRPDRMSLVDRNILRLATYEILYRPDIPPKVSIDEAVRLAKEYSDEDSSGFVNGILDALGADRLEHEPHQPSVASAEQPSDASTESAGLESEPTPSQLLRRRKAKEWQRRKKRGGQ